MMIAVNKSHLEASSRNGESSPSPPSQYGCLTPSPPASPSEINLYNGNETNSEEKVEKTLNLSNRNYEDSSKSGTFKPETIQLERGRTTDKVF